MNRNLGLSAGLVALFALMFHISPIGSGQKPETAAPPATTTKAKNATTSEAAGGNNEIPIVEGSWYATRAAFGLSASLVKQWKLGKPKCLAGSQDPQCSNTVKEFFGIAESEGVATVLATVPDPWHTRLALMTDGYLDAIETAATEAGWVFTGQWLPWLDPIDPDVKDPSKRRSQRKLAREQEDEPGVLVFRQEVMPSTVQGGLQPQDSACVCRRRDANRRNRSSSVS